MIRNASSEHWKAMKFKVLLWFCVLSQIKQGEYLNAIIFFFFQVKQNRFRGVSILQYKNLHTAAQPAYAQVSVKSVTVSGIAFTLMHNVHVCSSLLTEPRKVCRKSAEMYILNIIYNSDRWYYDTTTKPLILFFYFFGYFVCLSCLLTIADMF